MTCSFCH